MKLNWKAVLLGWLAEWAVIFLFMMAFLFGAAAIKGGFGALENWDFEDVPAYIYGTLILNFIFQCFGGWVAATVVKRDEISHAAISGLISFIFGWVLILSPLSSYDVNSRDVLWAILTIPAYIIGARLRARRGYVVKTELPISQPPIPEP